MQVSEVWELDLACRQAQGGRGLSELPARSRGGVQASRAQEGVRHQEESGWAWDSRPGREFLCHGNRVTLGKPLNCPEPALSLSDGGNT